MTNLFKKVAVLTDPHFGKRSDSPVHNQDCLDFIDWFVAGALINKVDRIIMIGDWFDNRSRLRLDTIHCGNQGMRKLLEVAPVDIVVGNHDMFFRGNRSVHSLDIYRDWPGITLYENHTMIGNVGFCPFLVGTEYLEVADMEVKYIFGHFELPHFLLNSSVEMPDRGGLHADHFIHPSMVFSGHFHKRQLKTNKSGIPIWYIGSPFAHDFNDVGDNLRGMMILAWGKEPVFIDWDKAPMYQRFKISEVITMIDDEKIEELTKPKSVLEVKDDIGLELEDITAVREALSPFVREVRMIPGKLTPGMDQQVEVDELDGKDLNTIVVEHLMQIDPHGSEIEPELLVKMYRGE